jgi:hypothetical protein
LWEILCKHCVILGLNSSSPLDAAAARFYTQFHRGTIWGSLVVFRGPLENRTLESQRGRFDTSDALRQPSSFLIEQRRLTSVLIL